MAGLNDAIHTDKLASTIRPFAPILSEALGGSLRSSAISLICRSIAPGSDSINDSSVLLTLLESDPDAITKLVALERQFIAKYPRITIGMPDIMAILFIGIYVLSLIVNSKSLSEISNVIMVIVGYYFGSAFKKG